MISFNGENHPTLSRRSQLISGAYFLCRSGIACAVMSVYPAVHLLANGTVVTGPIEEPGINWLRPIEDVEKEVVFCDHSKGIMVVVNTTWEELKMGKHFPVAE